MNTDSRVPAWMRRTSWRNFVAVLEAYYVGQADHDQLKCALMRAAYDHRKGGPRAQS
jgi:hypothetical protein